MKGSRLAALLGLGVFLLGLWPLAARADDTGVLSEKELNAWLGEVLRSTASQQPLNAPVGEEALTQDGYAFLYEEATLFYNKPLLDTASKLLGVSVTGQELATPRGLTIGSPARLLVDTYGWQNPGLMTDGVMAPFYLLDRLPQAAYWAWGQVGESGLSMVNCFIHVRVGEERYTDAGIRYTLEEGLVTEIRVYGLGAVMSLQEVLGNLEAFDQTQEAITGDGPDRQRPTIPEGDAVKAEGGQGVSTAGTLPVSTQNAFDSTDLQFAQVDWLHLTPQGALAAFGEEHLAEEWTQDPQSGTWRASSQWAGGVSLSFALDGNKGNPRLAEWTLADGCPLEGPRGIRLGDCPQSVMDKFRCDGPAFAEGQEFFLYGEGTALPYAWGMRTGEEMTLAYAADVSGGEGASRKAVLSLRFLGESLASLTVYMD